MDLHALVYFPRPREKPGFAGNSEVPDQGNVENLEVVCANHRSSLYLANDGESSTSSVDHELNVENTERPSFVRSQGSRQISLTNKRLNKGIKFVTDMDRLDGVLADNSLHHHGMNNVDGASNISVRAIQPTNNVKPVTTNQKSRSAKDHLPTLRERNAAMYLSESMADVHFLVGSLSDTNTVTEVVPAHTYVLSLGSSVFRAMFHGGFEKHLQEAATDVEPIAFKKMLKYLYTDDVDLDNDTVLPTVYAAKKYLVSQLIVSCIEFLDKSLTASNVCLFITQTSLLMEDELMQKCWELIDALAPSVFVTDGFVDLDFATFKLVIQRDTLNIKNENNVFDAAIRWAETECCRQSLSSTVENKRRVLGDAFYLIRLPTMGLENFANGPAQSGLLTAEETRDVFLYLTAFNKPKVAFSTVPRIGVSIERCHRFQSAAYRNNQWRYRGRCDSIEFSSDRRIFIAGFGLYGSSNGSCDYKVLIELKKHRHTLVSTETRFLSDGSSNVYQVFFDQPLQIDADVFYSANALLEGNELSYFGQEGLSEVQVKDVTLQFQCSTLSTNGTGVQGGQIPEILFYQ